MSSRVLETVLTGRNLLSPVLTGAAHDVENYNDAIERANVGAGASAASAADKQGAAAAKVVAANTTVADSAKRTSDQVTESNTKAAASYGALADAMRTRLKAALADLPQAEITADSTPAERAIAAIRGDLQNLHDARIGVDLSTDEALAKADALRARLAELSATSTDIRVRVDTDAAAAELTQFFTKTRTQAEAAGDDAGSTLARGMQMSLVRNSPLIAAGITAGLALGAPAMIAGTALLFGGLGAVAVSQSQVVKQAWSQLGDTIKSEAANDAASLVPIYANMATRIGDDVRQLRPELTAAFTATGPLVDSFSNSVITAANTAMPGLVTALQHAGPVVDGLDTLIVDLGKGVDGLLTDISSHAPAAGTAMASLGSILGTLLPAVGQLVSVGAEVAAEILPPIAAGFHLVGEGLNLVAPVLPLVVTGFLAFKAVDMARTWLQGFSGDLRGVGTAGTVAAAELEASSAVSSSTLGRLRGAGVSALGAIKQAALDTRDGFTAGSTAADQMSDRVRDAAVVGATALSDGLNRAVDVGVAGLLTLPPAAATAGRGIASGVGTAVTATVSGLQSLPGVAQAAGRGIASGVGTAVSATVSGLQALPSVAASAGRGIAAGVSIGVDALAQVPARTRAVATAIASDVSAAASAVQRASAQMATSVASGARATVDYLGEIPGRAVAAGQALGGSLVSGARTAGSALVSGVAAAASTTVGAITSIPGAVSRAEVSLGSGLANAARQAGYQLADLPGKLASVASAVGSGFSSAVTTAGSAVQSTFSKIPTIVGGAASAMGKVASAAAGAATAIGTGMKSALSGLTSALGGPWGLAIAGATIGISLITSAIQKHQQSVAQDTQQITQWYQAQQQGGNAAVLATQNLTQKQQDLAAAQARLNDLQRQANDPNIGRASGALSAQIAVQKQKVDDLTTSLNQGKKAAADQTQQMSVQATQSQNVSAAMDTLDTQIQKYGTNSPQVASAARGLAAAQEAVTAQTTAEEIAMTGLNTQLVAAGTNTVTLLQAQTGYSGAALATTSAEQQYAAAVKEHGKNSLEAQQASVALQQAIEGQGQALGQVATAQLPANATATQKADAANAGMLATLLNLQQTMGASFPASMAATITQLQGTVSQGALATAQFDKLGLTVLGVPDSKSVIVSSTSKEVDAELSALGFHVTHLPDGTVRVEAANTGPTEAVIDNVARNRTSTITVNVKTESAAGAGPAALARAAGLSGPGLARGGVIHAYAAGGMELSPMQGGIAQVVHANTWRIVGDRVKDDEFYIPDNDDPRSQQIGAEYVRRHPDVAAAALGASRVAYNAAGTGFTAAASPGYGSAATSTGAVIDYGRLGQAVAAAMQATGGTGRSGALVQMNGVTIGDQGDANQLAERLAYIGRTRGW